MLTLTLSRPSAPAPSRSTLARANRHLAWAMHLPLMGFLMLAVDRADWSPWQIGLIATACALTGVALSLRALRELVAALPPERRRQARQGTASA